jgi:hypothetical protein
MLHNQIWTLKHNSQKKKKHSCSNELEDLSSIWRRGGLVNYVYCPCLLRGSSQTFRVNISFCGSYDDWIFICNVHICTWKLKIAAIVKGMKWFEFQVLITKTKIPWGVGKNKDSRKKMLKKEATNLLGEESSIFYCTSKFTNSKISCIICRWGRRFSSRSE